MQFSNLKRKLTEPSGDLIHDIKSIEGDIMILGVGGKMGPTMAKLAKNAVDQAGVQKNVIGVSRFSKVELKKELENHGIETISTDLLDNQQLKQLPNVKNIIFMAGHKFGTKGKGTFYLGNEYIFTWSCCGEIQKFTNCFFLNGECLSI